MCDENQKEQKDKKRWALHTRLLEGSECGTASLKEEKDNLHPRYSLKVLYNNVVQYQHSFTRGKSC